MRKIFITSAILLLSICSFSQVKLGLKASPNLSWNRVIVPKGVDVDGNGLKFRFGGGAFLDFMFSDNYAFSTGINYTTKGAGIKYTTVDTAGAEVPVKSVYSLQYLEIPVSLKLFTNEIGTDMKLYFQVGNTLNTNLSAKVDDEKSYKDIDDKTINYTKFFKFFDVSLLVSSGVEMQMGDATYFTIGATYNRGLLNADADYQDSSIDGFILKNDYVSIDVGLKF